MVLPAYTMADYIPPPTNDSLNVRGVKVSPADIAQLKPILFSEISNRTPDKQMMEGRIIINTALNRVPQFKAHGKDYTLSDVLTQPNAYKGYDPQEKTNKQYNIYKQGNLNSLDQKKANIVDQLIQELQSGKLQDTTGGRVFYNHSKDGKIWLGGKNLYK